MGGPYILLFQDFFQKCVQTLRGESDVPDEDIPGPKLFSETEEPLGTEEELSYLYMPVM